MSARILLIDDEQAIHGAIRRAVRPPAWDVTSAFDGPGGLELFRTGGYDAVILDLNLPGINGLMVLRLLLEHDPDAAVLVVTGGGDVPTVVEAMQLGAETLLQKPFDFEILEETLDRAVEKVRLRRINRMSKAREDDGFRLATLGTSPAMEPVIQQVDRLAATGSTLLLQGETGTGKSALAELVHSLSLRPRGPFVEIACAGVAAMHLDEELFGRERGDGRPAQRGLLEAAQGGTLFLDEIGELAPEIQAKLLPVVEHGRFRRLGGVRTVEVDLRIVASTRRDLRELVRSGSFREDLFFRIAVHPVTLPPLRDRGAEAVTALAYGMLEQLHRTFGRGPTRIANDALGALVAHPWPGNLRELRNVLERAILTAPDAPELLARHLPRELVPARTQRPHAATGPCRDLASVVAEAERGHVARVLVDTHGNRALAARHLGISRATLYEKLKRHHLEV